MITDRKPGRLLTGSLFGAALSAVFGLATLAVAPPAPAMAQTDPASLEFSLAPDESRELPLGTVATYTETGSIDMAAQVVCEETESSVVTDTVAVG